MADHKANVHGAAVGHGGLADQMARRTRRDGSTAGGQAVNGTSIFDPVLAELLIRWFSIPGAIVLDPFAGGSVRGIVSAMLGRTYFGIDLSERQIVANREQAVKIVPEGLVMPTWIVGDSGYVLYDRDLPFKMVDFILTCPPYADLEKYSNDTRDISTMKYPDFFQAYTAIMKVACDRLRDNRFVAVVTSDARGKDSAYDGAYYGFPAHTVAMMQSFGLKLWNECPLVTPAGSVPTRTKLGFERNRKMGRVHQVVHVYLKGDARAAVDALGPCDFGSDDPLEALDAPTGNPLEGLGTLL